MGIRDSYKFIAGGNISPSRFVVLDTTYDSTVTQAGTTNVRCIGVSQTGLAKAPGSAGATAYAGVDGDPMQLYLPGDIAPVQVGAAGVTKGNMVRTDSSGQAVVALTSNAVLQWVQGIALENGSAGEIVNVLLTTPMPYYPALS